MAANWTKIRNDYINGKGSYQKLADKYGVSASTLRQRAAREKWTESKAEQEHKTRIKIEQKTAEKIADTEADAAATMARIELKLIQRIEKAVDDLEDTDASDLRRLVQSYKDMAEVRAVNSGEEKSGALNDILAAVKGVGND